MTDDEVESKYETAHVQRLPARLAGLFRGGVRELMVATERRVALLDALRAFAVLLVMNAHFSNAFLRSYGPSAYTRFILTRGGWMGVDLFFVLSGYFIGTQLWLELRRTGTVSIKQFMIRRGLRIWPLYFAIFVFLLFALPGPTIAEKQYGWTDVLFLTNYVNHGIVDGSWSLCTEEQFYLLTPLALLLIGRRSMRAYRWGLGALLGFVVAGRAAAFVLLTGHFFGKDARVFNLLYVPFPTHCDGLITGLFVANLTASKERFKGLLARPALLVLLSFLLLVALSAVQGDIFQFTGLGILFAAIVWWAVSTNANYLGQHIFYLISRLSFGMYLNHEYFAPFIVRRVEPALGLMRLGAASATGAGFVLLALLSMALSAVTFCLIEHPFLVLRTAMLRRVTPPLTAH